MIFLSTLLWLFAPTITVSLSYLFGLDIAIINRLFGLSATGGILACLYYYFPPWDDFSWDDKIKLVVGEQLVYKKTVENKNPNLHFSNKDNGSSDTVMSGVGEGIYLSSLIYLLRKVRMQEKALIQIKIILVLIY